MLIKNNNVNFQYFVNFIDSYNGHLSYSDICLDAIEQNIDKDLYKYWPIVVRLIDEHNSKKL